MQDKSRKRNFFRKAQLKKYNNQRYGNPYFKQEQKKPLWIYGIAGLLFGVFIALSSFFLTAPKFIFSTIRVEGLDTIPPQTIKIIAQNYLDEHSFFFFSNRNSLIFDAEELKKRMTKSFSFDSIDIQKENSILAIIVKEKLSTFLWQTYEDDFIVDDKGVVIKTISDEEKDAIINPPILFGPTRSGVPLRSTVPLVFFFDSSNTSVDINDEVLTQEEVDQTLLFRQLAQAEGIDVNRFEMNRVAGAWMKVNTIVGYDILFDPALPIDKQIDNLIIVLRDSVQDQQNLEYIDLRFEDHIYFK